ncbi:Esterase FE4 [Eumeta japonica]|uniref:Esterase FE4 n=1 Tax=Eumeta variegata TaxID=151549 RepID=A0A4C1X027_EUMVA|nr:Esterase FE4 [Eumeta japonica]
MTTPLVTVAQGALKGRIDTTPSGKRYYSFEGIPYARPPVGSLRFRDPQDPKPWSGVRDATKPGNICAQIDLLRMKNFEGSEDCLYLNIHTPYLKTEQKTKLPVIFFLHGGRYLVGYGHYYRPDYFMEKDAILVTVNYRLNILGFLCLDTPEVPGNAGMKDAVLALKWVKDNIECFNGDENNITVSGESSGGGTASAFLTSKMADGLYHKIIVVSGNFVSDLMMAEDHIGAAKKVASMLGNDVEDTTELYEVLQNAPLEDLVRNASLLQLSTRHIKSVFLPVVEKEFKNVIPFFTEDPVISLKNNRFYKVPILTGYCTHEGALFLPVASDGTLMFNEDPNFFIPFFLKYQRDSPGVNNFMAKLRKFYFDNRQLDDSLKENYLHLMDDAFFLRDIFRFLEYLTEYHRDVWLFKYNFNGAMATRTMKNLGLKGASHSDILPYLFYRSNKVKNMRESDVKIINYLTDIWTNFAKSGTPSWSGQNIKWPTFSSKSEVCLDINEELRVMEYPEKERMQFWKSIIVDAEKSKL